MSLQDSLLKIGIFTIFLFVLIGCQQSPSSAVIVEINPDEPKHVIVKSVPETVNEPVEVPIDIEEEPVFIPDNVLPSEPEVIVVPENKPAADPVAECVRQCESSCETSAKSACSQSSGSACKNVCGNIINPSACSTACSLRSARICEPKFNDFCKSQCNSKCY